MPAAVCERLRERAIHAPAEAALVIYGAGKSSDIWTWARLDRVTAGIADVLSTAATSPALYLAAGQLKCVQVGGDTVDPGEVESVDQLPHAETGKIDRRGPAGQVAREDIADARRGEGSSRTQAATRRLNFHG
jgi:acyl-CoA synthetase (AMP-forming)/AMP-acid ligase II